ncbi:MAG: hypothetical protein H0T70_11140 [Acidimicrobiia bacterium]|nr:hypothetical protein [Acidimicrobiia bacterium]
MATPVGPAAPDPDDPELWDEWYQDDDDVDTATVGRFGWPVRLLALLVVIGLVLVYVVA